MSAVLLRLTVVRGRRRLDNDWSTFILLFLFLDLLQSVDLFHDLILIIADWHGQRSVCVGRGCGRNQQANVFGVPGEFGISKQLLRPGDIMSHLAFKDNDGVLVGKSHKVLLN